MAAEDLSRVLAVPGRLVLGPTQAGLLLAYPHGGTALGLVDAAHVEETEESFPVRAEEWGQTVGFVRGFTGYVLGFTMLQWDPDALNLLYRTTTTSAGGFADGARTLLESQPGRLTPSSPVLFAPDDPAHPGVLVYAPVPFVGPAARRLELALDKGLEVSAILVATRDANGRTIAVGRLEDLTLA